ncbi:MAG: hypothetical protein GIX03_01310 [Candidatus Eremiobacteraeota bacterium]|nr:hypothetical protein [Candidatus Eremiobacteraeota bacterium]MBC5801658.1 hypothetical protein [Candidatus Eremiobacteraeota bacterium]MBC5824060.1 hypothetical protein [Candidatus Eremiobacteraeota bacterium]
MADERRSNQQIAEALQTREVRVCKWRRRFARDRMRGLRDGAPRHAPNIWRFDPAANS